MVVGMPGLPALKRGEDIFRVASSGIGAVRWGILLCFDAFVVLKCGRNAI